MPGLDPAFLKKLLATFKLEAEEHTSVISSGLVELESADDPARRKEIVELIFREAHSLKGAARSVSLGKVEAICQSLETLFAEMKAKASVPSLELFDRLHHMVAAVSKEIAQALPADAIAPPVAPTVPPPPTGVVSTPNPDRPGFGETIRVGTAKLESVLLQAEELNVTRAIDAHFATQLSGLHTIFTGWERDWRRVRLNLKTLEQSAANGNARLSCEEKRSTDISQLVAFLDRNERNLRQVGVQFAAARKTFETDRRGRDRQTAELLENVKRLTMLPFASLLEIFPKLVRDLCRDCQKEAELTTRGSEVEAERRILDELKGPLIHLVRNCIDHGIEGPAERRERNKPQRARIAIEINPKRGDRVEIALSDDGGGIDQAKVRATAVKIGLLSTEEAQKLDDRQAVSLIFQSGFSTRPTVTEVSGRGLGLAIVRDKVIGLGGEVTVETTPGAGTIFRLSLPQTMTQFRGILLRAGQQEYAIPSMHVQRALRVRHVDIKSVENRAVTEWDSRTIPIVWLAEILGEGAPPHVADSFKWPGMLLEWGGERIIFLVDEILRDQEILVKNLGKQLLRVRNISGGAVLETGRIVPVLNVADLMQAAAQMSPALPLRDVVSKKKSILVAEDSITARTLLKGVLESSGYAVTTAVDGAEAFQLLETRPFDLVVSDVEMPRMTGFDLTAKIRKIPKMAELPVILVTALDSQEDRARGADAGANAYIVKSSFEQSNLLDAVERFI